MDTFYVYKWPLQWERLAHPVRPASLDIAYMGQFAHIALIDFILIIC